MFENIRLYHTKRGYSFHLSHLRTDISGGSTGTCQICYKIHWISGSANHTEKYEATNYCSMCDNQSASVKKYMLL